MSSPVFASGSLLMLDLAVDYFKDIVSVNGFTCPEAPQHDPNGGPDYHHKLYADPDDCRYFYTCQNGVTPVRNGCPVGTVFDSHGLVCNSPEAVPECATYYDQPTQGF